MGLTNYLIPHTCSCCYGVAELTEKEINLLRRSSKLDISKKVGLIRNFNSYNYCCSLHYGDEGKHYCLDLDLRAIFLESIFKNSYK